MWYYLKLAISHPLKMMQLLIKRMARDLKLEYHFMGGRSLSPETVIICPTMRCNYRCKMCYARKACEVDTSTHKELSREEYFSLIDQIAAFSQVLSIGGGEPLVRDDVKDMIQHAKSHDLICNLATNGGLLTEKVAGELITAGLDFISISLDSSHLAGASELDVDASSAVSGIKNILKVRAEMKSTAPRINVSCHIDLEDDLLIPKRIMDLFNELKWDKLSYYPVHFYMESMISDQKEFLKQNIYSGEPFGVKLPDDYIFDRERIDRFIEFLNDAVNNKNVDVYKNGDPSFYHKYFSKISFDMPYCQALYSGMLIDAYGEVFLCHNYSLGNVRTGKLLEMWNSEKAVNFRILRKSRPHPICFRCS